MEKKFVSDSMQKKYKLIVFDVDGTLVPGVSAWEKVHKYLGTMDKRNKNKEKFFNNEITISDWVMADVEVWKSKGVTRDDIIKAFSGTSAIDGMEDLMKGLKKCGYKIAIISGSLDIYVDIVLKDFKRYFDFIFVNKLLFDKNDRVVGVSPSEFDYEKKIDGVRKICNELSIDLKDAVFVGDGMNDVLVMKSCGFGIAINPSDELKEVADVIIEGDIGKILDYVCEK